MGEEAEDTEEVEEDAEIEVETDEGRSAKAQAAAWAAVLIPPQKEETLLRPVWLQRSWTSSTPNSSLLLISMFMSLRDNCSPYGECLNVTRMLGGCTTIWKIKAGFNPFIALHTHIIASQLGT